MPNLLLFSPAELHSIKIQVQDEAALYHAATNAWIEYCKNNMNENASHGFFKEEVLPAAMRFSNELENNKLLMRHRDAGNDQQVISFFLAEFTPAAVWQLYYDAKCIPDEEEWKEIIARKDEPAFARPRPVMLMHLPAPDPDENKPALKKSINID